MDYLCLGMTEQTYFVGDITPKSSHATDIQPRKNPDTRSLSTQNARSRSLLFADHQDPCATELGVQGPQG